MWTYGRGILKPNNYSKHLSGQACFSYKVFFFLLFCSKQNWDEEDVIELGLSALHLADISYSNGVKVEKGEIGKMFKVSQIVSCLASY